MFRFWGWGGRGKFEINLPIPSKGLAVGEWRGGRGEQKKKEKGQKKGEWGREGKQKEKKKEKKGERLWEKERTFSFLKSNGYGVPP